MKSAVHCCSIKRASIYSSRSHQPRKFAFCRGFLQGILNDPNITAEKQEKIRAKYEVWFECHDLVRPNVFSRRVASEDV